jgi:hypothetical protein
MLIVSKMNAMIHKTTTSSAQPRLFAAVCRYRSRATRFAQADSFEALKGPPFYRSNILAHRLL